MRMMQEGHDVRLPEYVGDSCLKHMKKILAYVLPTYDS